MAPPFSETYLRIGHCSRRAGGAAEEKALLRWETSWGIQQSEYDTSSIDSFAAQKFISIPHPLFTRTPWPNAAQELADARRGVQCTTHVAPRMPPPARRAHQRTVGRLHPPASLWPHTPLLTHCLSCPKTRGAWWGPASEAPAGDRPSQRHQIRGGTQPRARCAHERPRPWPPLAHLGFPHASRRGVPRSS